ncbi:hypothetical protein [Candidatus Methylocalor cossyra]|uniref:Protein kinase domain-containing protein n=1 Tax=Candidatus Methylocalor cossyra TaxID=3108543 RepID=A0ABM9NKS2_9GAMM
MGCVAYELLTGKHPYGKLAADQALELGLQPKPAAASRVSLYLASTRPGNRSGSRCS